METRAKLSTKLLSMFLSVLMAFGCFSVALPGLVPDASAVSKDKWNALRNAFNEANTAGYFGGEHGSPTFSKGVLKDTSDKGYLYTVAELIMEISQDDYADYNHHKKMRQHIKDKIGGLNNSQKKFIDDMLPMMSGDYGEHPDNNKKDRVKDNWWGQGYYPDPQFTQSVDSTIKVTRTLNAAIIHDCPTIDDVKDKINTEITFKAVGEAKTSKWYEDIKYGIDNYHTYEWYEDAKPTISYKQTATYPKGAFVNYVNYVNDNVKFADGYNAYKENPDVLNDKDAKELNAVEGPYNEVRGPINESQFYIDNFFPEGQAGINARDNYVKACTSLAQVKAYIPYIKWIQDGKSVTGYHNRDDYKKATEEEIYSPENVKLMKELRQQATDMMNFIESAEPDAKQILVDDYHYNKQEFEDYIAILKNYIDIYELNELNSAAEFRMMKDETQCYDNKPELWGAKNYESMKYPKDECPVTDIMLFQVEEWFRAKVNVIDNSSAENQTIVSADLITKVRDFSAKLTEEKNFRNSDIDFRTDYFAYFEEFRTRDFALMSNEAVIEDIGEAEAKLKELKQYIEKVRAEYGDEKTERIFGTYADEAQRIIYTVYEVLLDREYGYHHRLLEVALDLTENDEFDGTAADDVAPGNFSLVKRAVAEIRNDTVLWNWYNANKELLKNLGSEKVQRIDEWNPLLPKYDAAVNEVIANRWKFEKISLDNPTGHYLTREPMNADMIRTVGKEKDNYEVTVGKVETVIEKLDIFLTSDSFAKLIGAYSTEPWYDETLGIEIPAVKNLSEYIEAVLVQKLFNDKMVNTIIASLFPMLADKLVDIIKDLLRDGLPGKIIPPNGYADGSVNLNQLIQNVDAITVHSGVADLYVDGKSSPKGSTTNPLSEVFANLGLKVFPTYFADALTENFNPDFYKALKKADKDWKYFDNTANGGNGNGKVDAEDFKAYKWNVNNYDSFVNVVGQIFNAALPILQTVLTNRTYNTGMINGLAAVQGKNLSVTATVQDPVFHVDIPLDVQMNWLTATGNVDLTIAGIKGYNDLYAPIVESLLGQYSPSATNDVSVEHPLSATLGTSGKKCTSQQIVAGIFMPLYALIKKVADKPIDTVLGLLPNITQYISYNCIQPLLNILKLNISLKLNLTNIDFDGTGGLGTLADVFKGTVTRILSDQKFAIGPIKVNLAENLTKDKLDSLVGADISDLNAILDKFLNKPIAEGIEQRPVSFPAINSGRLSRLGELKTYDSIRSVNFNCDLKAGKRYYIEADKADVLYDLLSWLLGFVAIPGNLSGLLVNLGQKPLDPDIEALLGGIQPEDALAALVELFVTQDYDFTEYKWYRSANNSFNFNSVTDFVYLKYANNWTREKASYFYNNVDSVVNTIINMINPELLEGKEGINEWLLDKINSIFDNQGIMNVINLVNGIGASLADKPKIVNLVKDQLAAEGTDMVLDLMIWYNSFGYLTYDYTQVDPETGALPATAPKKPEQPGYVKNELFKDIKVEVKDTGTTDPATGKPIKEYQWYFKDAKLVDGAPDARSIFTKIFCVLFRPFSPVFSLLLTGKDLTMFGNALTVNGYECYSSAIIPLFEVLGIYDAPTQEEYNKMCQDNGPTAGFDYLVELLFNRVEDLLKIEEINIDGAIVEYGPIQKIVDMIPNLFYFLQSGGLSVFLKNLLQPLWALVDTLRPIANVDIDAFLHKILCALPGMLKPGAANFNYDITDEENYPTSPLVELIAKKMKLNPVYDAEKAEKDKSIVDGIFQISVEDLTLENIIFVVNTMFGIDLTPIRYAFEGICIEGYVADGKIYGVKEYDSKSGKKACKLDYNGADTITVLVSVLLDILRYGNNAENIDKMIPALMPDAAAAGVTAQGLLEALLVVFEDKVDSMGKQPNWDYLVEERTVNTTDGTLEWQDGDYDKLQYVTDFDNYHSINNLAYVTDWTQETAKATDEVLSNILDYIVPMLDPARPDDPDYVPAATFEQFVNNLLNDKVYSGELLKTIAGGMASIFNALPPEIVSLIDKILEVNMADWYQYVSLQDVEHTDADGHVTTVNEFAARPDYEWWADPSAAAYVDTKDEFVNAAKQMLMPAAKLFGLIFLQESYRLFYTVGDPNIEDTNPDNGYGDDAIVLNGANAYAIGLIPLLEALGMDLSEYKPAKYNILTTPGEQAKFNNELFVNDLFDILVTLIDTILEDPVNWLIEKLPGIIYYINANGLSTALENVFGSIKEVIDAVNVMLPADQQIDLSTIIPGVDLTQLNLSGIFKMIEAKTGLHVRADLEEYMKSLYVGDVKAFTSANGQTAFTMVYSTKEQRHDMITILIALALEFIEDKGEYQDADGNTVEYDNPIALDKLINGGDETKPNNVDSIVDALTNPDSIVYKDIKWNYFDEKFDIADKTATDGSVNVDGYAYQYLNYTTDWTYEKAVKAADGFEGLILGVLGMTGQNVEGKTLGQVLKEMAGITNLYSGETLQKLLDLVRPLLFGKDAAIPEALVNLLGCMLGAELSQWNNEYAFETKKADQVYEAADETGLVFRMADIMEKVLDADGNPVLDADGNEQFVATGDKVKTYAIETQEDFITGATILFKPAERLLAWLLFGKSYEFFKGNTEATADDSLIILGGTNGYKEGLALLLEALGCKDLKKADSYIDGEGNVDMTAFIRDIATSLTTRIEELLDDPANEIVNLIPELLYYINAGGLQVSIGNLLAGPLSLVNKVAPLTGMGANLDEIVQTVLRDALHNDAITFKMNGINLQYIFELVETLTGLEITDVVGNKLAYFYMGEIYKYDSASEKLAYKMRFATNRPENPHEDFADFITILLSFVVDIALHEGNAAAIEKLANLEPGLVQGIINFIKTEYVIEIKDIDWFYFDETVNADGLNPGDTVTLPPRTINYLSYASDWTEETADYVLQNRNEIISAVLSMTGNGDTTLAQIIADKFDLNRDLYTAKNLNAILNKVRELTAGLDKAILDLAGLVIDVDLGAYKTMPDFTDEEIHDRMSFVAGLTDIIAPIYRLLDWLLFGDNMEFFDKKVDPENEESAIEVLLSLKGAEGYAYGIVPLLEALGVFLPPFDPATAKTEDIFFPLVNNVLARAEAILANPVDEALALLPNLIYFINTNGLAACINNLLGGLLVLLDEVNKVLPDDKKIDINKLLSDALGKEITIDFDNLDLDLLAIVKIAEEATGLKIADVVTEAKLDKFYLGQMDYYTSSNGKPAFRMVYSEDESAAEMLTIVLNFAVELVLYKDEATGKTNAEVLETMLNLDPGTIQNIIAVIPTLGAEPNYEDYDWNYMGGTVDDTTKAITLPATPFLNYFTYDTDWTQEKANYIYDNLDGIITSVLQMTGAPETADTVKEILDQKIDLNRDLYTAANLNKIVDLVKNALTGIDARLLEVAGVILGVDLNAYNSMSFTDEQIKDRITFLNGLTKVLAPVYRVLDWLLFNKTMEYFVKAEDGTTTLIKVAGNEGYKEGLVPLLEALGVKLPEIPLSGACCNTMLFDVLDAVLARVEGILADPIDEVLALIPNLLYFINANGVSTAVKNLLGAVLNVIAILKENGVEIDLGDLLNGIDVNNLDLEGIFAILETKIPAIAGLEINNAFKGKVTENADGTVSFEHDVNGENIIEKFYLGSIENFVSTNGELAYRMVLPEGKQGDLLTFLVSFALDLVKYNNNSKVIDGIAGLPEGTIGAIITILAEKLELNMGTMDWVYFLELTPEEKEAKLNEVLAGKVNNLPELPERTLHYIEYDNNWNEETAQYLVDNLSEIVDLVINMATNSQYVDLDDFISDKLVIYSDATVDLLVSKIAGIVGAIDGELLVTLGDVLDADIYEFKHYKSEGVHDRETFIASLTTAFSKVGFLLDWLLFGRDLTFFTKLEDGTPATINLPGNEGYKYGLAPILEAIGVDTKIGTLPAVTEEKSVTEQVIGQVFSNVCDRIDEILADPIPQVIDLLLELVYFLDAKGVVTCVHNFIAPIEQLFDAIEKTSGNHDLNFVKMFGVDADAFDLKGICQLLKDKTGIDIYGAAGDYLSTFYFGELKYYESFGGVGGFHMVYTDTEQPHDMVTIVLSVVLDTLVYPGNKDAIIKLLGEEKGEDIYNVVMAFLTDGEVEVPMQQFKWLFTEHADTGKVLSPITVDGSLYNYMYGKYYTREMGEYITKWLPHFIDTMIVLLGVEKPNGGNYGSLEDILDELLGNTIYKAEYVQKILEAVQGLIAKIKEAVGPELFAHISAVLNSALGVDLTYWDNYEIGEIAEGDRNAFVNEIVRMLEPAYPILEFVLTSKDLAFFNKDTTDPVPSDKNSYVVIHGAEGYAYAIIPLLEALHCNNVLTPDEYKAAIEADSGALLRTVIDPLLDKVDEVLADPIHKAVEILPGVIYFLNSNGLDTIFKNLINSIIRILETIEPLTGEIDLYEIIGFDFQVNIEGLIDQALKKVEEDTGFTLTKVAMEAITELTAGKVVSFTSKNGDLAYTMEYAPGADQADLVTIILRLLLTFVSVPENAQALEAILKDKLNEEGYKFICSLLDNFSQMAATPEGMDEIMYTVYWIFYSANVAASETENWLAEFNGDYSFLNQLFATSDLAFLRQIEISMGDLLNKYTGDIIDDDELVPNGFIKFFKQIAALFQKIIQFFQNLFK